MKIIWKRILCICLAMALLLPANIFSKTKDDAYASKTVNWGLSYHGHERPGGDVPYTGFSLKKYDTLYVGNTKKKVIYLTFDCGYENGHTKQILDILKKNKIHAIFFVTRPYILENSKLVKRMKKEGHLVGNHTTNHPRLSGCSTKRIQDEVKGVEKAMKKTTGYSLDKFIRPPEGNYSIHALKTLQSMGYTTVLWSLAWYDYEESNQPAVSSVVGKFKNYYHKGMVPLIHVISSADTKALPQIISFMKSKKYKFGLLSDLKKTKKK